MLLQESNLTARQPCRAPIMLYILFNQNNHLAKEGLVNFTRYTGFELGSSELHASVLPTTVQTPTPVLCERTFWYGT